MSGRARARALAGALAALALVAFAPRGGADRVDYFQQQLGAAGFKVRLQAAYILGTLGDRRAVPALVQALGDSHYAVRGAAAMALGALRDPAATEPLVRAAADEEAWVRAEVMKAFGRLRSPACLATVVAALDDADWKVRYQAARTLGRLGDARAILPLARVIEAGIETPEVVEEARGALKQLAPSLDVAEIQGRLRAHGDKHERARAAVILGVLADRVAVPALVEALVDPEPYVRGYAALALSSLGDPRALAPLAALVGRETHGRVKSIAALALAVLKRKVQ